MRLHKILILIAAICCCGVLYSCGAQQWGQDDEQFAIGMLDGSWTLSVEEDGGQRNYTLTIQSGQILSVSSDAGPLNNVKALLDCHREGPRSIEIIRQTTDSAGLTWLESTTFRFGPAGGNLLQNIKNRQCAGTCVTSKIDKDDIFPQPPSRQVNAVLVATER